MTCDMGNWLAMQIPRSLDKVAQSVSVSETNQTNFFYSSIHPHSTPAHTAFKKSVGRPRELAKLSFVKQHSFLSFLSHHHSCGYDSLSIWYVVVEYEKREYLFTSYFQSYLLRLLTRFSLVESNRPFINYFSAGGGVADDENDDRLPRCSISY